MSTTTTTANLDIDYVQKDYFSAEDALINFATIQFGPGTEANRLWTDFNLSSFSRNWLDIVAFMSDVFFFYMDTQATQSYLQTATINSAIQNIAKQFGFTPATAQSASGVASITFNAAGTYPLHSRLQSMNGDQFFTTSAIVAPSSGIFSVNVLQGQLNTQNFIAKGVQNETFSLSAANVIVDLVETISTENSPLVTVNGNNYTLVTSFIFSNGTDTSAVTDSSGNVIGGGGRVFQLGQRADGTSFIEFGDGTFGRQLSPGDIVAINYRSGGGTSGNIPAQTLTTLIDTFSFVSSATNAAQFSGGADAQTISEVQQLVPASLRTLDRAVAQDDYSEILVLNFPQVLTASTEVSTTPGVDLNIYVVPNASTVTPITTNAPLLNTLTNFLDLRKMVTVQFAIKNAFSIDMLFSMTVYLNSTASQSVVSAAITTALQNYFNLQTGGASGTGIGFATEILIENITPLISSIPGISRFEFTKFTYSPRVQKNIVSSQTTYNVSNVEIFPNVSESEWLLAAAGSVTETTGVVLFNNNANATYTYTSSTGLIQYTSSILPETLNSVAPGDFFKDGSGATYEIFGINSASNNLYITTGLDIYTFTVTAANATVGAVYTNNSQNFTVNSTISGGTTLSCTITTNGSPTSSGTLTLVSGTGDATITFSAETGTTLNANPGAGNGGSIRTGTNSHESYKVYKKTLCTATNLTVNSITDIGQDFSIFSSTGVALASNTIIDNTQAFIPNQYVGYYLEDNAGNLWTILSNDSDTITLNTPAINNSGISVVSSGAYKIVPNLTASEILFNGEIFSINYNTHNTFYSIGAQFLNIGTIGNSFQVCKTQTNKGNLGVAVNPISYNGSTGQILLNSSPDLNGINSNFFFVDATGQIFRITSVDNRESFATFYDNTHYNTDLIISGVGANVVLGQGFQAPSTSVYPAVSWYMQRQGNAQGNVVVQIAADSGGLPGAIIATSNPIAVSSLTFDTNNNIGSNASPTISSGYSKTTFTFTTPPTLTMGTQYHLLVSGDSTYRLNQKNNVKNYDNTISPTAYTYNSGTGVVQYTSAIGLSSVVPGNFIQDQASNLFEVLAVNAGSFTVTIATAQSFVADPTPTGDSGTIFAKDNIYIGIDSVSPSYPSGTLETYNGTTWTHYSPTSDGIFWVEYPHSITVPTTSGQTPVPGPGATISARYYDDNNEVSLIVGLSGGIVTSATDVTPYGLGTVNSVPNSPVDSFVFRTSRYIDDIVNLRGSEIPQLITSGLNITLFGGAS